MIQWRTVRKELEEYPYAMRLKYYKVFIGQHPQWRPRILNSLKLVVVSLKNQTYAANQYCMHKQSVSRATCLFIKFLIDKRIIKHESKDR